MPGIFLGSSLLKKGVSWRGFKGSVIFALGFYTHDVLFPNPERFLKETIKTLAVIESLAAEERARMAEIVEAKKAFDDLLQLSRARAAELKELKTANGLSNRVVNRRKSLSGVSYEETDRKK